MTTNRSTEDVDHLSVNFQLVVSVSVSNFQGLGLKRQVLGLVTERSRSWSRVCWFRSRSRQWRNRKKFSAGGGAKSLFPIFSRRDFRFFPVETSILVDPLKVSVVLSFFTFFFTLKFLIFLLYFFIFSIFPHFPPSLFYFSSFFFYIFHFPPFS